MPFEPAGDREITEISCKKAVMLDICMENQTSSRTVAHFIFAEEWNGYLS